MRVHERLRQRGLPTLDAEEHEQALTLDRLAPGSTGRVLGVCDEGEPAISRRLFDLGFAPGATVEVVRRAPLADPVVFRIAGYDIALRRVQARRIQVCTQAQL